MARPILASWNSRKARPPWDDSDLERKLDEAIRKRDEADPSRVGRLLRSARTDEDDVAVNPYAGPVGDQPEPRPIREELLPVPALRAEMIPAPLRPWVADIAERVGCPLEYVAVGALVAVATLVGRKLGIRPKRRDDRSVVPNLWGAVVGRPGEFKTPALDEATRPLRRLAAAAGQKHDGAVAAHQAEVVTARIEADAARDAYKAALKPSSGATPERLAALKAALAASPPAPPVRRRHVVNDVTVEKLVEIMEDNPDGLLQHRDELTGWLRSLDKQGRETDRAFYLEAWNGTGSFTSDRIGRGTVHAPSICLSLLGGIQPGPLSRYLQAAARGNGQQDDGPLSRFQLLVHPDPVETWTNVDRYPDAEGKARAFTVFEGLDALEPVSVGAEADPIREGPPTLRFSGEAQELFDEWRSTLENEKLRSGEESPMIESHLAKYRSLMPSLALLFHLIEVVDGAEAAGPVTLSSAELAAIWCDLLEAHARRIYHSGADGDPDPARRLAGRIQEGKVVSPFTVREVAQHGWSGLDTTELVDRAVAALADHDHVRVIEVPTRGRPRTLIFINPRVPIGARE